MFKKFLEKKGFTADQFKEMSVSEQAELQNEYLGSLESQFKNYANRDDFDALSKQFEKCSTKEDFAKLDKDIEALAKKVEAMTEGRTKAKKALKEAISEQIKKNKSLPEAQKGFNVIVKADNLFNISVIDGGTWDEDEVNIDNNLKLEGAIETGFAADLRREATVLAEMRNAVPLRIGDALKWVEPHDANGKPLTRKEAQEKPIGTVKYKRMSKESTKIAIYFQIAEEFLNRADFLMAEVQNHFRDLVTEVLEEVAFGATDGILSYATPFVAPVGYEVPYANKFDAIVAAATSQKLLKYRPSHVVLNSADIAMMFGSKGADEHYQLANGQSIQLIDGGQTLVAGTVRLKVMEVDGDLLPTGTLVVIDWSKLKYGLGQVIAKSDPYTNMRDNVLNFLMEAPFAVARPGNYPYAVVSSSFDTIIEAIDKPIGSN